MWHGNRLTRMLIQKDNLDRNLLAANRTQWYSVDMRILNPEIQVTFYPSYCDEDTEEFIKTSLIISNNICLQVNF